MKTSRPFLSSCIALMSAIFISACGDDNSFSATDSPIESSSSIEYIEPTINSSADSDSVESSSKHTISSSSTTTVSSSSIESSNSNEVTSSSSTKEDTVVVSSSSTKEDTVVVSSSSNSNNNKEESSSSMENDVESCSSNELDVLSSSSSSELIVSSSSEKNVESSSSSELIESSSSSELIESSSSMENDVESSSSEEIVNSSSSVDEDYVDENEEKSTEPHYVELDELKLNGFRVENNIAYLSWENNTDYTMQINVTYAIGCNVVSIGNVSVLDTTIMYTIKANSVKEKAIYEIKNENAVKKCIGYVKAITATENDKSNFVGWEMGSDRGLSDITFGN